MRYNPFQPNSIVAPGIFSGRTEELITVENSLFQNKCGNPQHFLLEGERGIGKSSLVNLIGKMGRGDFVLREPRSLLVVAVDVGGVTSQIDLIKKIARSLKGEIGRSEPVKKAAKQAWDFLSNWEVLGVRYHKEALPDADDAREGLVDQVISLVEATAMTKEGLVFLIDEADAAPVDARLGEFLKTFSEQLNMRSCSNVLFGLAGLPSTMGKLAASHESAPRMFNALKLDALSDQECGDIIKKAFKKANENNQRPTSINDDALALLSNMSEGYPHFVQQFGYSAFEADTDGVVNVADVISGAHSENGAIAQLGRKFFDQLYYSKINSEDYRKVLLAMASHGDQWASRKDIADSCGVKATTFNNALNALKTRNIILADDTRQGFYRLPTRSFAAWINAVNAVEKGSGDQVAITADL